MARDISVNSKVKIVKEFRYNGCIFPAGTFGRIIEKTADGSECLLLVFESETNRNARRLIDIPLIHLEEVFGERHGPIL